MDRLHKDIDDFVCSDRRSGRDRRATNGENPIRPNRRDHEDRRNQTARRTHQRYPVNVFTFVKFWDDDEEDIGQLLDISKGGLSFRYFVNDKNPKNFNRLSIVSSGSDSAITTVPVRTVSDIELSNMAAAGPIVFRRSGVEFKDLAPSQRSELDDLLKNYLFKEA